MRFLSVSSIRPGVLAAGLLYAAMVVAAPAEDSKRAETPELPAAAKGSRAEAGRTLLQDTGDWLYPSCVHCHSYLAPEVESKQTHRMQAHTLFGAAQRAGWRNRNTYADVGDASQYCAKKFQDRPKGLTASQRKGLVAYLMQLGPKGDKKLPKREVKRPRLHKDKAKYEGGDAKKGQAAYERTCVECHNDGEHAVSFAIKPKRKSKSIIVRKVRGFDRRGRFKPSAMGYYTDERLSHDTLRDILAYLGK